MQCPLSTKPSNVTPAPVSNINQPNTPLSVARLNQKYGSINPTKASPKIDDCRKQVTPNRNKKNVVINLDGISDLDSPNNNKCKCPKVAKGIACLVTAIVFGLSLYRIIKQFLRPGPAPDESTANKEGIETFAAFIGFVVSSYLIKLDILRAYNYLVKNDEITTTE